MGKRLFATKTETLIDIMTREFGGIDESKANKDKTKEILAQLNKAKKYSQSQSAAETFSKNLASTYAEAYNDKFKNNRKDSQNIKDLMTELKKLNNKIFGEKYTEADAKATIEQDELIKTLYTNDKDLAACSSGLYEFFENPVGDSPSLKKVTSGTPEKNGKKLEKHVKACAKAFRKSKQDIKATQKKAIAEIQKACKIAEDYETWFINQQLTANKTSDKNQLQQLREQAKKQWENYNKHIKDSQKQSLLRSDYTEILKAKEDILTSYGTAATYCYEIDPAALTLPEQTFKELEKFMERAKKFLELVKTSNR